MTINYQFGDVDAHGAMIRAQAGLLEAEHQAIVRDVLAAGDFWGGAGSVACQGFITQLGRNFQVIYEQANAHGQKVQALTYLGGVLLACAVIHARVGTPKLGDTP
ncbi:WXG100 family type VII secretion target [Mycobacterium tuberculosis]|uniref:WXG100 family type VII secretion target n=4 Tax=Mycobacterium tuberculosis TaxID=1773 RepID=UPI001F18AD8C